MTTERIVWLDGLRFAAAIAVVMFHYGFRGQAAGVMPSLDLAAWFTAFSQYGFLGVNLFFMISGFVIAWSAHERPSLEFAALRFVRLYPAHLAAMTITFAMTIAFGAPLFSADLSQYAANLTMLAPFFGRPFMDGAYWSIVLELIFYGWVFLFLALGMFERYCSRILLAWLAISLVNEMALDIRAFRLALITEFAGYFSAGILMFRLRAKLSDSATLPLLGLSIAVCVITSLRRLPLIAQEYQTDFSIWITGAVIVALFPILYAATAPRPANTTSRILMTLGALSYPLYLIHQHIGYIAFNQLPDTIKGFPAFVLVTSGVIALSVLVWRFVERPIVPPLRSRALRLARRAARASPRRGQAEV